MGTCCERAQYVPVEESEPVRKNPARLEFIKNLPRPHRGLEVVSEAIVFQEGLMTHWNEGDPEAERLMLEYFDNILRFISQRSKLVVDGYCAQHFRRDGMDGVRELIRMNLILAPMWYDAETETRVDRMAKKGALTRDSWIFSIATSGRDDDRKECIEGVVLALEAARRSKMLADIIAGLNVLFRVNVPEHIVFIQRKERHKAWRELFISENISVCPQVLIPMDFDFDLELDLEPESDGEM